MPQNPMFRCLLTATLTISPTISSVVVTLPNGLIPFGSRPALAQATDPRRAEADRLLQQGDQQYRTNQYEAALQSWEAALTLYRTLQDRNGEAGALGSLGNAYWSLSQYEWALDYYQQALPIFQAVNDRNGEAKVLMNLGLAYGSLSQYERAIDYHQQALPIYQAVNDRNGEASVLNNLGVAYRSLSQYERAIDYHQQALPIYQAVNDRNGEASVLMNLGAAYWSLSQYERAIDYHQQALPIYQAVNDRNGEASVLNNLGLAYGSLSQYERAIDYHQQALPIYQAVNDRNGEASVLNNLGTAYWSLSQYERAIDYHQQALPIYQAVNDRNGEAEVLGNLGNAYGSLSQHERAIASYQQALPIFQAVKDRNGEALALNNWGYALYQLGNLSQAAPLLYRSIEVQESIQVDLQTDSFKVSLFDSQHRPYPTLQQVLIAQNQPAQALEVAERGRARAFVELLAAKQATTDQPPAVTSITLAEIQQVAQQQKATLVEYSIIDNELFIWVVKPTGEVAFEQVDLSALPQDEGKSRLQTLVDASRHEDLFARGRSISFVEQPATISAAIARIRAQANTFEHLQQLHSLLIEPISEHLPDDPNDRIIFLPQGELFFVPFPALQAADQSFLIEKHTMTTAPAIQVLQLTRQQRQRLGNSPASAPSMLIVGNPAMPSIGDPPQPLSSLPGAEEEANAIAMLFGAQALIGGQAKKARVVAQMQSARIIHLATHGLLDDYKGLGVPGAIALAPDGGAKGLGEIDGLLTSSEILDLQLQADLVVLSACDTGRGTLTGDGVIGLSRSLISAGTPSVLVSLWKVPDDSTSFLMQEFYTNRQAGMDKAQALRQAMLTAKDKFPEPKDWAAFTLIGEAE